MENAENIVIVTRHGLPEHQRHDAHLLPEGVRQAESIAEQLVALGLVPARLDHSPLARVAETAKALCAAFSAAGQPVPASSAFWLSDDHYTRFSDIPPQVKGAGPLMLVTHEPNMRGLAMSLLPRDEFKRAFGDAQRRIFHAETIVIAATLNEDGTLPARAGRALHVLSPSVP